MCLLLLVGVIGYSFALYQVRYTKRIIYTTVSDFTANNKDVILAVYYDDEKKDSFPPKNTGYVYLKTECDNNSEAYFDTNSWSLYLNTKGQDKCDVYFVKNESTPNVPELYQGLIPVVFDDSGNMTVADTTSEWYNYDKHEWANAVLVNASDSAISNKYFNNGKLRENIAGTTVPMSEVLQMYVWIPRYKYQLFNVNNEAKDEQMINIIFENGTSNTGDIKCTYTNENNGNIKEECINKTTKTAAKNGEWYTHPAFTFKGTTEESGTELTGIWVGKFEPNGSNTNLKIIPNVATLQNVNISYMFNAARAIDLQYSNRFNLNSTEIDTHMMKNIEWGAMAYLTQSKYGRCSNNMCNEVTINGTYTTGYANTSYQWNTQKGVLASTTGNMYGIYDTNGGAWEYVMGNMVNSEGTYFASSSELTVAPKQKYYDVYEYDPSNELTYKRGHLGDATREILKKLGENKASWNSDHSSLVYYTSSWFDRGGRVEDGLYAGIFAFDKTPGLAYNRGNTFCIVLTVQDE